MRSIIGFKIGSCHWLVCKASELCWKASTYKVVVFSQNWVAHGARVSWYLICSPKSEGVLGLRNLEVWNKACILHYVRSILAEEGSLWIVCIKKYVMKGRSFRDVAPNSTSSWNWRGMLKLKELAAGNNVHRILAIR
ncbi:hypothetical protein PVK06_037632 [Gossypium arboreum]|uniref:Uncharacterized protein n=1 Tax=Gossypium arboreum TaxID=29729 RepID=A0ABR0MXW7_GOSAR|nr:hypothetical protein PVK06_037632 [Gossypium arboreum]